ncbi:hypothetical protein GZH53_17445 [Flavihumibacter sp. R14]|nr:hypothetical protein [Flavihumibacter soli]
MPTKFDEKRLWLVAAAVAFAGFFAVLVKKLLSLPDKDEPELQGKKMHCYLHLPAEMIDKYVKSGAKKMKFRFVNDNKRVKLHLAGYDEEISNASIRRWTLSHQIMTWNWKTRSSDTSRKRADTNCCTIFLPKNLSGTGISDPLNAICRTVKAM